MPKLSKKERILWGFFIRPETGKRSYNTDCVRCIFDCKQSFRAVLEACPRYVSRHSKAAKREALASAGKKRDGNTGGCLLLKKSLTTEENAKIPTLKHYF